MSSSPPLKAKYCVGFIGHEFCELPSLVNAVAGGEAPGPTSSSSTTFSPVTINITLPRSGESRPVVFTQISNPREINANVDAVVMAYSPVQPASWDLLRDVWAPFWVTSAQQLPRCGRVLCGTRTELLGSSSVLKTLQKAGVAPLTVEGASELANALMCHAAVDVCVTATGTCSLDILQVHIGRVLEDVDAVQFDARDVRMRLEIQRNASVAMGAKSSGPVWSCQRHKGKLWYVNKKTRKAQRERPDDFDGEEVEMTPEEIAEETARKTKALEHKMKEQRARELQAQEIASLETHTKAKEQLEDKLAALTEEVTRFDAQLAALRTEQADAIALQESTKKRYEGILEEREALEAQRRNDAQKHTEAMEALARELEEVRKGMAALTNSSNTVATTTTDEAIHEAEGTARATALHLTEVLEETAKLRTEHTRLVAMRDQVIVDKDTLHAASMKLEEECSDLFTRAKDAQEANLSLQETQRNLGTLLSQHRARQEQSTLQLIELREERERLTEMGRQLDIRIAQQRQLLQSSMEATDDHGNAIGSVKQHQRLVSEQKGELELSLRVGIRAITKMSITLVEKYFEAQRLRADLLDSADQERVLHEDVCDLLTTKRATIEDVVQRLSARQAAVAEYREGLRRAPQRPLGHQSDRNALRHVDAQLRALQRETHDHVVACTECEEDLTRREMGIANDFDRIQQAVEMSDTVMKDVEGHANMDLSSASSLEEATERVRAVGLQGVSKATLSALEQQERQHPKHTTDSNHHLESYESLVKKVKARVDSGLPKRLDACQVPKYNVDTPTRRRMRF
eukprot:PhM_4_TR6965/c0_g1_i1/m.15433